MATATLPPTIQPMVEQGYHTLSSRVLEKIRKLWYNSSPDKKKYCLMGSQKDQSLPASDWSFLLFPTKWGDSYYLTIKLILKR